MIERQPSSWERISLLVVLLCGFLLLVALPIAGLFADRLPAGDGLTERLRGHLLDGEFQWTLRRSLAIALLAATAASVIAIPLAGVATRAAPAWRTLLLMSTCLPLATPGFVTAALLGQAGIDPASALGPWLAPAGLSGDDLVLAAVQAWHLFPLILLCLTLGLQRIDRSLTDSARNLGARRLTAWRLVTLPLMIPAYSLGLVLVMLRVLEDAATPLMLGVDGLLAPQLLQLDGATGPADAQVAVTGLILMAVTLLVTVLGWSVLIPPDGRRLLPAGPSPIRHRRGSADLAAVVAAFGITACGLVPVLGMVSSSLGQPVGAGFPAGPLDLGVYRSLLTSADDPLEMTLAYAAGAGLLTSLLGALLAVPLSRPGSLARMTRSALVALFAVPGVLLAVAYRHLATQPGPAPDPGVALVLVTTLKLLPFAAAFFAWRLRPLWQGPMETARNLGDGRARAITGMVLPSLAGTSAAVMLLGAAAVAAELSAALVLAVGPETPLAVAAFHALQHPEQATVGAAQAVLLVTLIAAALLSAYWLLRPRCRRDTGCLHRKSKEPERLHDNYRAFQP